ncbi:hypothetical protein EST38_g2063 [Candolleomyces aberdarensis]|uniref:beta-N-acetylhexosaminidase n=1 Tax=Candolleomyces aberdarensis TaxID=2316362 RepID=A0A4Q2DTF2_9AGAR|nr:hypothetical protein EST38_g2063 [Candolleomyces aberdarensis]
MRRLIISIWIVAEESGSETILERKAVFGWLCRELKSSHDLRNSWCDPFKSWQKAYAFDPLAKLSSAEASLVLGGQQLLWTEQASPENLDPIVWPRAAVSSEIFWTGPRHPSGQFRTVAEALHRLHDVRFRMVQRGVSAIPLQPQWCALRPGQCDSGGLPSTIWGFALKKLTKVIKRYKRIALSLTNNYLERIRYNEL